MPATLGAKLQRYRPYLIALVAVLLIVVVPHREDDDDDAAGAGNTAVAAGAEDIQVDADTAAAATLGAATGGAAAGRTAAAGRPGAAAAGATPAAPSSAAVAATGAGIGSPEALKGKSCDPATKRLKVAFVRTAPCVVPWPKGADNGGATAQGVTADKIKVVIYNPPSDPNNPLFQPEDPAEMKAAWEHAAAVYEKFYEQWGRKVDYVVFNATGSDEVSQRADAISIANMKPFMAVRVEAGQPVLQAELAARKIVTFANSAVSQKTAKKLAPYLYGSNVPPGELVSLSAANYIGRKLVGRPARWAGQPEYQALPRKFGMIHSSDVDPAVFETEFAKFGGALTDRQQYAFGPGNAGQWAEQARTMVARMKSKGVTSVVAVSDFIFLGVVTKEATNQQWLPEWITTGLLGQDIDLFAKTFDQVQWAHAFGAGSLYPGSSLPPPQIYVQDWYWGEQLTRPCCLAEDEANMIFGGLHGAGPKLTPETFRDGMFSVPPAGGAAVGGLISIAYSFGRWGFFPEDDYNAFDDFVEIWWDASGSGRDNLTGVPGTGLYRYVDGGKRYFYNQWPQGEPGVFDTNGIAPYYEDYPTAAERPPDYPCTGCPSQGG